MNTCQFDAALLEAFTEGDLFLEDMIQVQKHLDTCPDCQAYVEDLITMRAAFPSVEDTVVPENFTANVMAAVAANPRTAVAAETPAAPAAKAAKKKTPWLRVAVSLAACCAIVVAVDSMSGGGMKELSMAMTQTTAEEATVEESTEIAYAVAESQEEETMEEPALAQEVLADTTTESASAPEVTGGQPAPLQEEPLYCMEAVLDAETAGGLLAGYEPVLDVVSKRAGSDTETREIHYELTVEQYEALLAQLADLGEIPAEEVFDTDSDTVLLILR